MDNEVNEARGAMETPMANEPTSGLRDGNFNTRQKKVLHKSKGVQTSVTIEPVNVSSFCHNLVCNPLGFWDIKI